MGLYINPRGDKMGWLKKYGQRINLEIFMGYDYDKITQKVPVCCVDNGPFLAVAVAYSKRENDEFSRPSDKRPKTYWLVNRFDIDESAGVSEGDAGSYGLRPEDYIIDGDTATTTQAGGLEILEISNHSSPFKNSCDCSGSH